MKSTIQLLVASAIAFGAVAPAFAGPNDFFGGSAPINVGNAGAAPGQVDPAAAPPGAATAAQQLGAMPGGNPEFTDDEKRMRKKYKSNIASAQRLILKAVAMVKLGEKTNDQKAVKKGKILQDIGERRLAELKANSPFPELAAKAVPPKTQ